jgi:hypothetical protein
LSVPAQRATAAGRRWRAGATHVPTLAFAVWTCALALSCAPVGIYRIEEMAAHRVPDAAPVPEDGRLAAREDTTVVLVYGDNRGGFRLQANAWRAWSTVRGFSTRDPGRWLAALGAVPLLAVQTVFPSLDGPRDLVTSFTQRPRGGGELEVLAALERALPADLVISTGDLVQDGRRGVQWEDFVRHHGRLRAQVPYAAAPGNHEAIHDPIASANWDAAMGPPREPGRYWYALEVGRSRFVFLDSNVLTDPHDDYPEAVEARFADAQLAWADSVLALPADHRFLVLHHPLVSTGHYLEDWAQPSAARHRERLLEMCFAHGVTAVLAGHEHLYDRGYVVSADGARGFWQVVTGGGGSPLYPVDASRRSLARSGDVKLAAGSERSKTAYHFARLEMPAAGPPRLVATEVRAFGATAPLDAFELTPYSPGRP